MKRFVAITCTLALLIGTFGFAPVQAAAPDEAEPQAVVGVPELRTIGFTSGELIAWDTETLRGNVSFVPSAAMPSIDLKFMVYKTVDGVTKLMTSKTQTVTGSASVDIPVIFSGNGAHQFHADRNEEGTLYFYNGSNVLLLQTRCKGKSAYGYPNVTDLW